MTLNYNQVYEKGKQDYKEAVLKAISNQVKIFSKQIEEHFKELDKRKIEIDVREKTMLASAPLVFSSRLKEELGLEENARKNRT